MTLSPPIPEVKEVKINGKTMYYTYNEDINAFEYKPARRGETLNERESQILDATIKAFELGGDISKMLSLSLEREFKIDNKIEEVLILPKRIVYTNNEGEEYTLNLEQLSDLRFKRSLSRGYAG